MYGDGGIARLPSVASLRTIVIGLIAAAVSLLTILSARAEEPAGKAHFEPPPVLGSTGLPAGMIFPVRGDSVRLSVANVTVLAPHEALASGKVISFYRLRNLGSRPVDLEIGFAHGIRQASPARRAIAADSLQLLANRRPLPLHIESITKMQHGMLPPTAFPDSFPAWDVTIPSFEMVDIDLTYPVSWTHQEDEEGQSRELALHAFPATLWNGPIDDFTVSFVFDEMTATLLNCAMEQEREKEETKDLKERKGETQDQKGPCPEVKVTPGGYEWYARGPGWRFRNTGFPADFRIRVSWRTEEEND